MQAKTGITDEANGAETEKNSTAPVSASRAAAIYALAILTLIYSLNFLDRTVITILIDPIKHDYHLSDKVMGFISGFGFVIMYSILAAPVARWADRGNRRSIITWGLLIWSGMTALAGIARNAVQLTLSRFGVGIGEAAGTAPSTSMISDLFPGAQRSTAMAVYQLGPVIGGFLGAFFCLLPIFTTHDLTIIVLSLAGGFFFAEIVIGPMWAIPMDIAPKYSGTAAGLMNTGSALAAILSPLAFGFVADLTGDWHLPFLGSLGLLLTGALLAGTMHPERAFEDA
jgi:MFS family permease